MESNQKQTTPNWIGYHADFMEAMMGWRNHVLNELAGATTDAEREEINREYADTMMERNDDLLILRRMAAKANGIDVSLVE